jgi:prophage antirepressor-like protein
VNNSLSPIVHQFHGRQVVQITFNGRPCWLLPLVEAAMDYAPTALGSLIRDDWKAEFVAGKHFEVLRGEQLKELRALLDATLPDLVASKASNITILYQEGLDLIAIKSDKQASRDLRAFLVEKVMPSIRETGAYIAPGTQPVDYAALAKAFGAEVANAIVPQLESRLAEIARAITASPNEPIGLEIAKSDIVGPIRRWARVQAMLTGKSYAHCKGRITTRVRTATEFAGYGSAWAHLPRTRLEVAKAVLRSADAEQQNEIRRESADRRRAIRQAMATGQVALPIDLAARRKQSDEKNGGAR